MSFTTYISIDVATKSLAIGLYKFRSFNNIVANAPSDDVIAANEYCNDTIQILSMHVFDINNGIKTKDTSISTKAKSLKCVLKQFDNEVDRCDESNIVVLIEYQMNANHMSNAIFNMLVYHYSDKYPIHVVKPSLKNTIALHPKFVLAEFLAVSSNNYKANKEHTKYNMLYLLTVLDNMHMIKDIKKKNYDDIADTLCQALAWHKCNCI